MAALKPHRLVRLQAHHHHHLHHRNASTDAFAASATIQAPPQRYPRTKPPSHKPPEFRKSQLHRQYTSVLRSAPLILLFQHNNFKAIEWMAVRRELAKALRKVDEARAAAEEEEGREGQLEEEGIAPAIKLQVVQTGLFAAALKVVEHFRPEEHDGSVLTHALSRTAYEAVAKKKVNRDLRPLLSGPLALLAFPRVSPPHLKAALSILAPSPPAFAAPTRRANPAYHEPVVQAGLQKLLLLAARVDGRVFDSEGVRWLGGIEGGLDGLRAQLVAMLQGVGAGVTGALESAGTSLFLTVEGRRKMLEEEQQQKGVGQAAAGGDTTEGE